MRYYRKIIRIRAEDSPNVRRALEYRILDGLVVVPGVLTWEDYQKRRATWDSIRQVIGLDALFPEVAGVLLFPPTWLNHSEELARSLHGRVRRAEAIGIDPAEGGDKTAMCAIDKFGVIELVSKKTPDTSKITGEGLAFMRKHQVPAERVAFDRGGGGKEHADRLRSQGYAVRTVAFGESISLDPKRGIRLFPEKVEQKEDRYAYKNRRAEMYGELSLLMDPQQGAQQPNGRGFAIPAEYTELRKELSVFKKDYDDEGRMVLPPKTKRDAKDQRQTLTDMIGHSPDEADALVLACHAMLHKPARMMAGAM